ncbi:TolB family protein [Deinococcus frigens]|uniref:TolB family protein n=1 Tax=Deinococcus frigens TaxID=249403 RepID=UPI001FE02DD6|nr:hypothetical protein [Deinococcus frigens]
MSQRISLEALAALPTVAALNVSRGGDQVAFYADWTGRFELYTLNLETRQRRQLTDGQAPKAIRAGFVWAADDSRIFFSRDHNGDERQALFDLNLESGEAKALQHDPQSMDYVADAHPDGQRLLINSTRGGQMNVHVYDLSKEGEDAWTALTALPNSTQAAAWSPDGTRLTLTTNESADLRNTDGYVLNADGSGLRRVLRVREGKSGQRGRVAPGRPARGRQQRCGRESASGPADRGNGRGAVADPRRRAHRGILRQLFSGWALAERDPQRGQHPDPGAVRHGDGRGAWAEAAARSGRGDRVRARGEPPAVQLCDRHHPPAGTAVQP